MTALVLLALCCAGALGLMACAVPGRTHSRANSRAQQWVQEWAQEWVRAGLTLLPLGVMAAVLLLSGPAPSSDTLEGPVSTASPAHPARSYRVTLAGLRLHLAPGEAAAIGGDAHADQLYIPELPAHLLTLKAARNGRLELAPPAEEDGGASAEEPALGGSPLGLVVYRGAGSAPGAEPDFGGTLFPPGSWLCRADRAGHCDASLPMLSYTLAAGQVQLLNNKTALCALGSQHPPATRSIYPLAAYAREGCRGEAPFSWDALEPAADFLYWGKDHQLYIRANGRANGPGNGPGALMMVGRGGSAAVVESGRRELPPGATLDVHLYRYELNRDAPRQNAAMSRAPTQEPATSYTRLTERRSFQLRHGAAGDVELILDTPEQHEIRLEDDHDPLSLVSQPATPTALTTQRGALGFRAIGGPLAAQLPNTIERLLLPEDGRRFCGSSTPDRLLVQGPAGASCAQLGRWFLLGDPERYQVRLRIAPLGRPAGWIWAMGLVVLMNLLIRQWLQCSRVQTLTLGVLELLLTFRILVAFDAAALDWRAEDAAAQAWLALLWIPLPLELVPQAGVPALQAAILRVIKLLFAAASTALIAGAQGVDASRMAGLKALLGDVHGPAAVVWVAVLLTVAAGALTRWDMAAVLGRLGKRVWAPIAGPIAARLPAALPWAQAVAPLLAVMLLHGVLVLLGFREQLAGVRIAAFIVPLLVLGWASLDRGMMAVFDGHSGAAPGPAGSKAGPLGMLVGVVLPFVPWLVFHGAHDNGAYVYFLAPAVCLAMLGSPRSAGPWWTSSLLAAALVSLAMFFLGFNPVLRPLFGGIGGPAAVLFVLAAVALIPLMRSHHSWRQPHAWRPLPLLTALGLVLALHGVGFWATWRSAAPADDPAAPMSAAMSAAVSTSMSTSMSAPMSPSALEGAKVPANLIRLMNQAVPEAVELLGTREGYEQRGAMLEMIEFAASLTGRGWPQSIAPQELRATHVNDTVTAVHILSPFGRLCGIGLALFLLAFVVAVFGLTADGPLERSRPAVLAALVLATTSLYMLLANIGVVPFTGRNFYFLSAQSQSDLLEGGLLLTIILGAITLGAARPMAGAADEAAEQTTRQTAP